MGGPQQSGNGQDVKWRGGPYQWMQAFTNVGQGPLQMALGYIDPCALSIGQLCILLLTAQAKRPPCAPPHPCYTPLSDGRAV